VKSVAAAAVAALALATAGTSATPAPPKVGGCQVLPATSAWNERVDTLPVAGDSSRLIASIGLSNGVHADFGSGLWDGSRIGIPYTVVHGKTTPKSRVSFEYADESDKGPYPIPGNVPIEGQPSSSNDGDRHALIVDRDSCRLYELYALQRVGSRWQAGSGAIFDLRSNRLRPAGWTSADAAGLPIFPGLARWSEAKHGAIHHALRFTVPETRKGFIYPARHYASSNTDPSLPAMGQRFRLKASFDISHFPRQSRIVLAALKKYGMIVADNGSSWFISGAPSRGWNNDDLHQLGRVTGSDFEAVNTSSLPRG
jgi:hypothetical protein